MSRKGPRGGALEQTWEGGPRGGAQETTLQTKELATWRGPRNKIGWVGPATGSWKLKREGGPRGGALGLTLRAKELGPLVGRPCEGV